MYDVIIVGGGPAGLNAALVLGRCRRKVLVCDSGNPRNVMAEEMHGYLTRDGINPVKFLRKGRKELEKYGVIFESREIIKTKKTDNIFELEDSKGNTFKAKKILIATGIKDKLPEIDGIKDYYGKSVHHCPYCDGWEVKDKKLAVYAAGKYAYALGVSLKTWSKDVMVFSDGQTMTKSIIGKLKKEKIECYTSKIKKLKGKKGELKSIVLESGEKIKRDAMFFHTAQNQRSHLAEQLGCEFSSDGFIKFDKKQETCIEGVFVAGDASKDMKFVVVAASEGAKAGVAINIQLQKEI